MYRVSSSSHIGNSTAIWRAVHAAVLTSSATLVPTSSLESVRNAYGNYSQLRIASEHVGGHGTYSQMRIDSHPDPNYASIWRRTSWKTRFYFANVSHIGSSTAIWRGASSNHFSNMWNIRQKKTYKFQEAPRHIAVSIDNLHMFYSWAYCLSQKNICLKNVKKNRKTKKVAHTAWQNWDLKK